LFFDLFQGIEIANIESPPAAAAEHFALISLTTPAAFQWVTAVGTFEFLFGLISLSVQFRLS
jgi:hypothetical protein